MLYMHYWDKKGGMMDLLNACKLAYRKHWLDDDSIGWDELGDILCDAICNSIGDDAFQQWLEDLRDKGQKEPPVSI